MRRLPVLFAGSNGQATVRLEECFLLTRQLHVLQKSGVPLLASLKALESQLPSASLRGILHEIHADLLEGRTLSQALSRHPRAFNSVYVGLIRVGEAGGLLDDVLSQLTRLLEWEIDVRNRLREALQYPIIVLLTLAAAVTVMAIFVLPQFAKMFQSFQLTLPLQTRLLIGLSHFLSRYGWLVLLLGLGAAAGWWAALRTERVRLWWHTRKLRLPVLGNILLQLSMSRFARVTAALNHSGVPILETLALAGESVNNRCVRAQVARVQQRVRDGSSLAVAMGAQPLFPPVVVQMVATGEETGQLDELLRSVSEYYDQQVAYTVRRLITYIEPVLLVVVGLGVLLMATAVFVPMWDLVKLFKQGR